MVLVNGADITPLGRKTAMPTYEYLCTKCGAEFVSIMSIKEFETTKPACPKCSSEEVKQQMSHFIPKTSRKS
jgi:putative FmdB family regulatory protein